MGIITTLIIGLIVGALAKLLMPGNDPGGIIGTVLLGIAGAFLARFPGQALGLCGEGERAGIFASILGAILLLAIYRLLRRGTTAG